MKRKDELQDEKFTTELNDFGRMNRRTFVKMAGVTAGAVAFGGLSSSLLERASASVQVTQTPLPGKSIPRFVDPLPNFAALGRVTGTNLTVSMVEFQQQVLPTGFINPTTVWGYKISNGTKTFGPHYPAFTIVAQRNTPITVKYVNNLGTSNKFPVLQKYLTVDQTIHWADPLKQSPSFSPYTGPVPAVTHLHGGEVPSAIDGGPTSWFTPGNIITGPGFVTDTYTYPNGQDATTLWFHDHALGVTRLSVYAGLAGIYFLRGAPESLVSPPLPGGAQEVELVIQDRQFDTNGQLFFPDGSNDGLNGPPPNPATHPFWIPEFIGDAIVVNGKTWPFLNVEPRRYRFRFLNGSNARFYELDVKNLVAGTSGPAIWQIGTDGGLLDAPAKVKTLLFAPGERADVIIDFAGFEGQTLTLVNGAKVPFPNGIAPDPKTTGQVMQFRVGTKKVNDTSFNPASGTPLRTGANSIVRLASGGALAAGVTPLVKRQLTLNEREGAGGPLELMLNNTLFDGTVTETPQVGSTEEWEIINISADTHPIHVHLVQFQVINRQMFNATQYLNAYNAAFPGGAYIPEFGPPSPYSTVNADGAIGGNPAISPFLQDGFIPPDPNEAGWKDTVRMNPGEVTRIVARWAPQDVKIIDVSAGKNLYSFDPTTGPGYVWHCHILDHEDNEMMRPYKVAP